MGRSHRFKTDGQGPGSVGAMDRRTSLKLFGAAAVAIRTAVARANTFTTRWTVGWQQGLDACLLLGVLSAPSLQSEAYPEDRQYWLDRLSPAAKDALARVRKAIDVDNGLLGPTLALSASAARSDTIEDTVGAFAEPDAMRTKFADTPFWSGPENWNTWAENFPDVVIVLAELSRQGFSDYWNTRKRALVEAKANSLRTELSRIDLIGAQQRYVGRPLNPDVVVYLSAFSEPHGIRIVGQRFLTSFDYPSRIVKRNAAHEIFHPFLLHARPETARITARLSLEPLLMRINARADKSDGYGSIAGLIEEGMVQALENLVSQQLGFGRHDMGAYWREQDGGIHVFAAAAAHAMRETSFARRGGDALSWLDVQCANGNLTGANLQRHAEAIIGGEAIQKWLS